MFKKKKNKLKKENEKIKFNKNLSEQRKQQLINDTDVIISKLSEDDIKFFEENSDFSENEINYIKKRKKLRASKRALFYSQIRCDEETLNRIVLNTRKIVKENRQRDLEEQKIHEKERKKDERTLASEKVGKIKRDEKIR